MNEKRITVKIDPLGRPTVEAHGFVGGSCAAATEAIEQALAGGRGVDRAFKDEWYQSETQSQTVEQAAW